ncbi:MAG: 50S ribosomal protein L22 [Anaerolineales bacterium]|nr:50S ribosomal protein L22 [Anaerolineales bacterium]
MTDVRAKMRYAPSSAQKMRRVMTAVRGRKAEEALAFLLSMPQTGAARLAKLLKSAIANAVQNQGLHKEDLVIAQMFADEGPTRKWRRFGARGRFKPILRRSSHVTIVLREKE